MRDDPGAPCPKCGAAATRQFFPAGIVFKGSGFYKTDSRGASSSSITSDTDSKSASSTKSDGAKTDGASSDATKSEKRTPVSEGSATTTKPASTDAAS
jgi:predicted nucleic acid-binding Zn ribbon protein